MLKEREPPLSSDEKMFLSASAATVVGLLSDCFIHLPPSSPTDYPPVSYLHIYASALVAPIFVSPLGECNFVEHLHSKYRRHL